MEIENEATGSTVNPNLETPNTGTQDAAAQDQETVDKEPFIPFKSGKEKFKADGKEHEWDWETTRKYASLGYASQARFEKAAETEKKARTFLERFQQSLLKDPEGTIRIFNPNWQPASGNRPGAGQSESQSGHNPADAQNADPRDAELAQLREKVQSFEQRFEQADLTEVRAQIQSELDEAVKKYPVLNDEISTEYVKQQYRRAIAKGIDISIEDVAFHVAQKVQQARTAKDQQTRETIENNKRRAPASTLPAGSGKKKELSLDDVKRMAGRI